MRATLFLFLPVLFVQDAGKLTDYIGHLERAESALEKNKPDQAIRECDKAIALNIPNGSRLKDRSGAAAHYLKACALAMKKRRDEALDELEAAAENGYTATDQVKKDDRLKNIRKSSRWRKVLAKFPSGPLKDRYAGKTVADSRFGNGLIKARMNNFPKVGEPAPDFELPYLEKSGKLKLSSFRGKKPVVLVFGSLT